MGWVPHISSPWVPNSLNPPLLSSQKSAFEQWSRPKEVKEQKHDSQLCGRADTTRGKLCSEPRRLINTSAAPRSLALPPRRRSPSSPRRRQGPPGCGTPGRRRLNKVTHAGTQRQSKQRRKGERVGSKHVAVCCHGDAGGRTVETVRLLFLTFSVWRVSRCQSGVKAKRSLLSANESLGSLLVGYIFKYVSHYNPPEIMLPSSTEWTL